MDNGVTLEILVKMGGQAACSLDGLQVFELGLLGATSEFSAPLSGRV
jgi:hypothetical protein